MMAHQILIIPLMPKVRNFQVSILNPKEKKIETGAIGIGVVSPSVNSADLLVSFQKLHLVTEGKS
jgi:hypothetical protein